MHGLLHARFHVELENAQSIILESHRVVLRRHLHDILSVTRPAADTASSPSTIPTAT